MFDLMVKNAPLLAVLSGGIIPSFALGAGFGCSIAGTIVQAIVFGLTFLPGANEPTLKLATPAQPAV